MLFVYIVLGVIFIGGILLAIFSFNYNELGGFLVIFTFFILIILGILHPCIYFSYVSNMKRYEVLKQEYENSEDTLLNASIRRDIIEFNMDLASIKYWNGVIIIEDFIPDKLVNLEYIK